MHFYLAEFSTLMLVFSFAVISPGADFLMVVRQSLMHGRKNAVVTSMGIGTALLVHVSYTILGLGLIIAHSIVLFNLIKWAGVVYLIYVGFKALFARGINVASSSGGQKTTVQSLRKAFMLGFAVNVLNPKAVFFFLSIFSTLVAATTPLGVQFGYGMGMSLILILWFTLVSVFMTTPSIRIIFSRASKWIDRVSGVVFIVFGIRLMFQKAS